MGIKCMNYTAVSGGTFTIGTSVNGKIKHTKIDIPSNFGNFLSVLEGRVNTINTINFQICPTQSLSQERLIINYDIDPITLGNTKIILNVSDMTSSELLRYNNLIKEINL